MQFFTPFITSKKHRLTRLVMAGLLLAALVVLLALPALAQNTYVITDGDHVTYHTSFSSDPAVVLDEAGVELDSDDFYTTAAFDGSTEIKVQRAQQVTVDYCGKLEQYSSYEETVGDLISRLGIQISGKYSLSHRKDAKIEDGMTLRISNVVETTEVYTVELPAETVYCSDPTLPLGQEKVLTAGSAGQLLRTASVVYLNTHEQSRTVLEETILEHPVDRIVAVGTGENVATTSADLYIGDDFIILPTGEVLTYTHTQTFEATAYTHLDDGCDMKTATQTTVHWGTVAVDPTVIPYGTRMFIITEDGSFVYGIGTAEDCGGAIKNNRLDLYMPTLSQAFSFGRRDVTVYFLGQSQWKDW